MSSVVRTLSGYSGVRCLATQVVATLSFEFSMCSFFSLRRSGKIRDVNLRERAGESHDFSDRVWRSGEISAGGSSSIHRGTILSGDPENPHALRTRLLIVSRYDSVPQSHHPMPTVMIRTCALNHSPGRFFDVCQCMAQIICQL